MGTQTAEISVHLKGTGPYITPRRADSGISDNLLKPVDVDFDRLVSHVENTIMTDHERAYASVGLAPQELLARSNPGLYSSLDTECGQDLTNPRDMYSILAYKNRSTEDLTSKLKHELAYSAQRSGEFPRLSRTVSMNEIRRTSNKTDKQLAKPFQNSSHMINEEKKLNVLVLTKRHSDSDDIKKIHNHRKLGTLILPTISRTTAGSECIGRLKGNTQRLQLPVLSRHSGLEQSANPQPEVRHNKYRRNLSVCQENLSVSDSKLDKWFSEMPNEVFDKAQRALMEESIKDRLKVYQGKRSQKIDLPNNVAKYTVGPKFRRMPNTYLELRVDSFGRHLHAEGGEKMNRYKMQQKSMHQLKMRAQEEIEGQNKRTRDDLMRSVSPRLRLQHKSFSNLTMVKRSVATPLDRTHRDESKIPPDKTVSTVNMYDRFQFPHEVKLKRKLSSNYEEYMERVPIVKPDLLHVYRNRILDRQKSDPHPNSPVSKLTEDEVVDNAVDRDTTRAAILNIALGKEEPKRRHPLFLEKTLLKHESATAIDHKCDAISESKSSTESGHIEEEESIELGESSTSPSKFIFTTIPTAKSSIRTSDSKSTASSVSLPKGTLAKFNRLEVFPEQSKRPDAVMVRRSYHGHKLRECDVRDANQQSYKLDLKQYPQSNDSPVKDGGETAASEVRMQDVVFRFEPGEVFITNKKANANVANRSSERARIIYGKVMHRDYHRHPMSRENTGPSQSMRSMEGYRSDYVKFENRALADSDDSQLQQGDVTQKMVPVNETGLTGVLSREGTFDDHKHCTTPADFFLKGKLMRNVAIETDVIGSESSQSPVRNRERHPTPCTVTEGADAIRPLSHMSDYIVDNNDGDSLDSDDGHPPESTRINDTTHNV